METISKKDVLDLIKQLSGNKATVSNDIPILVLKKSVSAYYETLTDIFNNCIRSGTFPEILEISHFSYCPLIWMFCSKKSAKKINAVNERSLRIIRNDYQSLYPWLLEEAHQIKFHQRCINSLMIEVYKYLNGHSPDIMNDIFKLRENTYFSEISTSSRQKILVHWNTDSMLFHIVLANSGKNCPLKTVR